MNATVPPQLLSSDEQHLKLLSIFHYVAGGLAALFACVPIIHLVVGLFMLIAPRSVDSSTPPPALFGLIFILFALIIIVAGWSFAALVVISGRFLSRRRHYMFCFVMACVECMFMPFGTVLGVFTLIVLIRQSVKDLFVPRPSW